MDSKALRLVLLGPRAIDGSNKRKRSQSRARKFAVTALSKSLLAFISTVVRLFKWLAVLNTDRTKLFFLLDKSSTTFSEEDDRFRNFFENRYVSLAVQLHEDLPQVLRETMKWLTCEVFEQQDDAEKAEMDEEQCEFEEELGKDIKEASEILRRRREAAVEEFRRDADGE